MTMAASADGEQLSASRSVAENAITGSPLTDITAADGTGAMGISMFMRQKSISDAEKQ